MFTLQATASLHQCFIDNVELDAGNWSHYSESASFADTVLGVSHSTAPSPSYASWLNGNIKKLGYWNRYLTSADVIVLFQAGAVHDDPVGVNVITFGNVRLDYDN